LLIRTLLYLVCHRLQSRVLVHPRGEMEANEQIQIRDNARAYNIYLRSIDLDEINEGCLRAFTQDIDGTAVC
jgi:hypothetical protein